RVVGAVDDEQRGGDAVGAVERRQLAQQRVVDVRVAVLGGGRRGDPRFGARVERGEVGDAAHVDADGEQVRVPGVRREGEVASVGAAGDPDAARVGEAGGDEEVDGLAHVGDGGEAPLAVVDGGERAPVAGRAAHVRG